MSRKKLETVSLICIIIIGLFIRFHDIVNIFPFGWDQARDSFAVVSLVKGQQLLEGPKTGIGNFHLGPLYFFLLAPFFLLTGFDPIALQYLNITINLLTLIIIFYTTKKLFSTNSALMILGMYALNAYVINMNRIPWNVTLVPALSFLIFYFTYQTFKTKQFKPTAILMTCCGIFFHAHFTAVVFPIMLGLLWLVNNHKLKMLWLFLQTLPFYLVWFVPTFIDFFITKQSHYYLTRDFLKYYFVGFHLQFFLYRLPSVLIQYFTLLSLPLVAGYLLLVVLGIGYFFTKEKLMIKIIFAWLLATFFIFGIYGGPISDYYLFFTLPAVYYTFVIIVREIFKLPRVIALVIVGIFLTYYAYVNLINDFQQANGGYTKQRDFARERARVSNPINFNEGDIESYLYFLYTKQLF
ncbi:MAG TPA: glycosyltransferase family 39 protein [Patescibacteria group bacterium]